LEKLKSTCDNERDKLILDFFFNTGLRISELVVIKRFHYQNNQLKVLGKGNKYRFIPLPNDLVKHFNNSDDYLFQTKTGKNLHVSQVRRIVYRGKQKAGIDKQISPHTFRRSFATLLNNKGAKLTSIQKLLGHSDINTTIGYIHNSYEEITQDCSKL
jgi:site-specific recombinase XerD